MRLFILCIFCLKLRLHFKTFTAKAFHLVQKPSRKYLFHPIRKLDVLQSRDGAGGRREHLNICAPARAYHLLQGFFVELGPDVFERQGVELRNKRGVGLAVMQSAEEVVVHALTATHL
ncbi:hypothetical protein C8R46DRAFT_1113580 [Mycena filopes]|nr:hypothetical protein C8R46DRAFT_1113580 [Mycena filopes]